MTVGSNREKPRLGDSFRECGLVQGHIRPIGLTVAMPVLPSVFF